MSRARKRTSPLSGALGRFKPAARDAGAAESPWASPAVEAQPGPGAEAEAEGGRDGSDPSAQVPEPRAERTSRRRLRPGTPARGLPRRRRPGSGAQRTGASGAGALTQGALGKVVDVATVVAGNRYGVAALILVAVSALYGAAALTRPGEPSELRGASVPVEAALVACPAAEQAARLSLVSGGEGEGTASVTALDGKAVAEVPAASALFTGEVKRGTALAVRADGGVAAGLEAAQTVVGKRGISSVPCTAPATEHWFVTPGPGAGGLELHVTNVDDVPATIDLDAVSDDGSLDTTDGKALDVPAHGTRVIKIGETLDGLGMIASDVRVLTLRVTATSGRVAAAVRADAGSKGADWATATAEPATRVIVPGVPGGGGRRTLYVGVPGGQDAQVKIRALTADGAFAPEGQDVLDVPARTVIPLDLEAALGGRPAAIELTSTRRIVAGFAAIGADLALGGAGTPLDGGTSALGAAPAPARGTGAQKAREAASLVLTAPGKAATVRVVPLTDSGAGTATEVEIPAGRTVEIPLDAPAVRVIPLPGSGPVYGTRIITTRTGQREQVATIRTLAAAPLTVTLPPVSDSLTSVVP
ncbi:hypothetical protein EDD29_7718 [Actinocorallia herbida]|uniref:Secreted protein n=1 Tax=Actinocorallia herbida TaxID=58109 RepID=A0A3N1D903_9ACTN|nr:DUF5719 family protein [Actinocorallia herbida]ROO90005.1 hypothetical protein EDD29_7718 [Actinocorallia herbida]